MLGELMECDMCLNLVLELLNICIGRLRPVTIRLSLVREMVICWLVRLGLKQIRLASAGHYTTESGEGDGYRLALVGLCGSD
jgi:hypothetical protein